MPPQPLRVYCNANLIEFHITMFLEQNVICLTETLETVAPASNSLLPLLFSIKDLMASLHMIGVPFFRIISGYGRTLRWIYANRVFSTVMRLICYLGDTSFICKVSPVLKSSNPHHIVAFHLAGSRGRPTDTDF